MHRDDRLHDELMAAFRDYFKAHTDWVEKGTRVSGLKTRKTLSKIKKLAMLRREEIMQWRYAIDREKAERKALQKATKEAKP